MIYNEDIVSVWRGIYDVSYRIKTKKKVSNTIYIYIYIYICAPFDSACFKVINVILNQ